MTVRHKRTGMIVAVGFGFATWSNRAKAVCDGLVALGFSPQHRTYAGTYLTGTGRRAARAVHNVVVSGATDSLRLLTLIYPVGVARKDERIEGVVRLCMRSGYPAWRAKWARILRSG